MADLKNFNSNPMFQQHPKSGVIEATPGVIQQLWRQEKAHREQDLKTLLIDNGYLSFKAQITFPRRFAGTKNIKRTFYSIETRTTYRQCLFGHADCIRLSKLDGYKNLIRMIEEDMKGDWLAAKIYTRSADTKDFDTLCRDYYKGGLKDCNDPVILETDIQLVYCTVNNGRVLLSDTPAPTAEDFRTQINHHLNQQS